MTATSLLLLALQCSMLGLAPGLQISMDPPAGCEDDVMQRLVDEVEMHDRRLVVQELYPHQKEKQAELAANGAIDKLDCAMQQINFPSGHRLASEFAHMMTVQNEPNKMLVSHTNNVITTMAKLVNWSVHFHHVDDIIVEDAENAAEAIWTLSRTGLSEIHFKLNQTGVADDFVAMLEREVPPMTQKGYMWAGAALGSLTRSYHEDNVDLITGEVRARIAQRPGIVALLVNKTAEGSAQAGSLRSQMPSHAERSPESRHFPHIYGWGAASALAGLAFDPSVQEELAGTPGAHELFCDLNMSYDHLEQEQAATVLALAFAHMDCGIYASVRVAEEHTEERERAWNERQRAADARAQKRHEDYVAKQMKAKVAVHVPGTPAEEAKMAADRKANEDARKKAADAKVSATAKQAADRKANEEARFAAADAKVAAKAKQAADRKANEEAKKAAADAKAAAKAKEAADRKAQEEAKKAAADAKVAAKAKEAADRKAQEEAKKAADKKAQEEAKKAAADAKVAAKAKEAADKKAQEEAKKAAADAKVAAKAKEAADNKAQEEAKKAADRQAQEEARKKAADAKAAVEAKAAADKKAQEEAKKAAADAKAAAKAK